MAKAKAKENAGVDYTGCYGPRMGFADTIDFLKRAFAADDWSEENNPKERFSTSIWGSSGCVLAGTKIKVRKISDNGKHNLIEVNKS